jgi:phosphoglycerate kinase
MQFIDTADIKNKRVLLRVDYNISLNPDHSIANDERIKQSLPTLQKLLADNNKLILVTHLGEPKGKDESFSLQPVVADLQRYFPDNPVRLVADFSNQEEMKQADKEILMLENIRFYPGEIANDPEFAKQLATLAEVYVNDAFAVCHRAHASVVGIPAFLPHYGGLLLQKEITMIRKTIDNPQKPFVAILGGSKISTKIKLIGKFIDLADHVILGGGLAHNFLLAQGKEIGKSIAEPTEVEHTKSLLIRALEHNTEIAIPEDAVVQSGETKSVDAIAPDDQILDIGPESEAHFGALIAEAKTIIWNGPVGKFEEPKFRHGTDFIYYAITENHQAVSVVGGGDTLAAMTNKDHIEKITHISTGGGAMLEFIENGTLPGIDALN